MPDSRRSFLLAHHVMSQGVTDEQKRCIVSWFRNWSAEQRAAFVLKVEQRITQRSDVDQVSALVTTLTLTQARSRSPAAERAHP